MITNVAGGSRFVSITPANVIVSDGTTNSTGISFDEVYFSGPAAAATTRTNLGLGWSALTNPQSSRYSGQATRLLGYTPEIVANNTNPTGFNVLAYTNTNGLVIPANILIGEDQTSGGPRNARNVTVNGAVTIQYPFSSPTTIYGNNSITATDDSTYTNTLATWNSNTVTFATNVSVAGSLEVSNAATTRTNLGLGETNIVTFNSLRLRAWSSGKLSFISAAGADLAGISVITNPSTSIRFGIGALGYPVAITTLGLEIGTSLAGQGAISFSQSNTNGAATTRTNLGLGATNNVEFNRVVAPRFQSTSSNAIIELDDNQFILTAAQAEFRQPIIFDNTTNAATTRTNLGGTTVGNAVFTATNAATARTAIGGTSFGGAIFAGTSATARPSLIASILGFSVTNNLGFDSSLTNLWTATNAAAAASAIGLGATWLTNTTAPLFWASVPASPTNSGTAGQIAYTNNFLYICISNNTWRRVQLGTW